MGRNIMSLWAKGQETVRFNGTSVWLLLASNLCFLEILDIDPTSKYNSIKIMSIAEQNPFPK
jgi:hypothetical protein